MKKYIIAAIAACALLPSVAFASFDVDLHYGSKGDDVVALQEFLTDQGFYSGPISGNFYSLTLTGVRKYQKSKGITPVSGYVGPITRGVINSTLSVDAGTSEGADATITPVVVPNPTPVQVQTVIPSGGSAPVSSPAPAPATSTPVVQACPSSPTLIVQWESTTVHAHYFSTCTLDPSTVWSYTNVAETNTGTIGGSSNVWYMTESLNDSMWDMYLYKQNPSHSVSVTVGTSTQVLSPQ